MTEGVWFAVIGERKHEARATQFMANLQNVRGELWFILTRFN